MNACYVFGTFIYMLFDLILSKTIVKIVLLSVALPSSSVLCPAPASLCCTTLAPSCASDTPISRQPRGLCTCYFSAWLALSLLLVCTHSYMFSQREPNCNSPQQLAISFYSLLCFPSLHDSYGCINRHTVCVLCIKADQVLYDCHLEQDLEYSKYSITVGKNGE